MLKLLSTFLLLSLIIACSENFPDAGENSVTTKALPNVPTLVSASEADLQQARNGIAIDEDSFFIISDSQKAFDNSALIQNQGIRSRAIDTINIKAGGSSQITKKVYYMGDQVFMYSVFDYDAVTGMRTQRTTYNGAGLDGIWFNADDDIRTYAKFDLLISDTQTHYVNYDGPGLDGVWLNEDDNIRYYMVDLLDSAGTVVSVAHISSAGIDTIWFTPDDTIQWSYTTTENADGSSEWVQYKDAGVDLDWTTVVDNAIGHYALKTVGSNTKVDQHTFYVNSGLDGIRFTEDDVVGFYHMYAYDVQDFLIESTLYRGGAGVDNLWFTADDIIKKCVLREPNVDGTLHLLTRANPGIDATCFSTDDEITSYDDHTYDTTGHLAASNLYGGPGIDGLWYTVDDSVVKESTFAIK